MTKSGDLRAQSARKSPNLANSRLGSPATEGGGLFSLNQITRRLMSATLIRQGWVVIVLAHLGSDGTTIVEPAARQRVDRLGNAAFDIRDAAFVSRVGDRHSREKRSCVGMQRLSQHVFGIAHLYNLTQVHNRQPVRH